MNFKAAFVLTSSLLAFNAFAANCIGDICVGDNVIDGSHYVGSVKSLDEANNEVTYLRLGASYLSKAPVTELSDEIISNKFPVGRLVIDSSNYIGTTKLAFRNGQVLYQRTGAGYTSVSSDLSPEVDKLGTMTTGSRLIDSNNYTGDIKALFKDGRVAYVRDGASYISVSTEVSGEAISYGDFSKKARLVDSNNYRGEIKEVFSDGRIKYLRDGASYFSVGNASDMSVKVGAVGAFKTGTVIIDSNNYTGEVSEVFKNSTVFYLRSGASYFSNSNAQDLSYEIAKKDNISSGTLVVDSSNYVGIVKKVFADGRMTYLRSGASYTSIATDLSPEVETHRLYNKDQKYATNSLIVGKPQAFFQNEKILIQGTVTSELFSQVDRVGSTNVNDEILALNAKTYKIKEMYENSVIVVSLDSDKEKTMKLSTMEQLNQSKNGFGLIVENLYRLTQNKEFVPSFAFIKDEVPALKKRLIQEIDKAENYSKDEKRNMFLLINLINSTIEQRPDQQEEKKIFALSVTPSELLSQVEKTLLSEGREYVVTNEEKAKLAPNAIIVNIDQKLFKASCDILVKDGGKTVKEISKKIKKSEVDSCIDELKN